MNLDRYAVIGNPVAHSRSPWIHGRFAELTGQALQYGRVLAPLEAFAATTQRFFDDGGCGCNITVPFKFDAAALAAQATPRAALAGAANLLHRAEDGRLRADNTDGAGLVADITTHAKTPLAGTRVLLVGAGGAAAGVLGPLLAAGPAHLVLVNRTPGRAQALAQRHAALAQAHGVRLEAHAIESPGEAFDVVINATASSLGGGGIPVPHGVLRPGTLALDMMYGPSAAGFMDWAAAHGAVARDGLGMLVEQAAEAFWVWRGVRPPTATVLAELRTLVAA